MWPDKVAVIYGSPRLTYAGFAAEAVRVAGALRASGVESGDRVAYLMPNLPELLVAHFAVPLAGGVLVAINTRLTAEEVSYILRHSGAKILVTDADLLPVAAAAAEGIGTVTQLVVAADTETGSAGPDLAAQPRLLATPSSSPARRPIRCPGRSRTSSLPSRSTTPPAPPGARRA